MKRRNPLNLNLAENPLRNKNLFHTLFFFSCGLSIVLLFVSLDTFYQYRTKNQNIKAALARVENRINYIKKEENRYSLRIQNLSEKNLLTVRSINHFIYRKSFSWTELFTALEKSIPALCYIQSISPLEKEDSRTVVKLGVASAGLDSLLLFINNLYKMNFSDFRLLREGRDKAGHLISEISLTYDKTN